MGKPIMAPMSAVGLSRDECLAIRKEALAAAAEVYRGTGSIDLVVAVALEERVLDMAASFEKYLKGKP